MSTPYSEALKIMQKAEKAIEAADYNIKGGFSLTAINRAYYVCYYSMAALLLTKNVYTKTHQGVRQKFSELFIKTGIFSEAVATLIKIAFDFRQQADYYFEADIPIEEATTLVEKTKEFYKRAFEYLNNTNITP